MFGEYNKELDDMCCAAACKADPCGGLNGKERLHMAMEYLGLSDINGPLVAVDGVKGVGFEEMVEMKTATGTRLGRIAALEGERAVIQVFAGTSGMTLSGTASRFTGSPMRLALAPEIVGRIFNGAGEPIDGLGPVYAERFEDINGSAINPVSRSYPRNYIRTVFLPSTALLR